MSVVDYSRWDHLSCYSEETDVERDQCLDDSYGMHPGGDEWYEEDEGLDEFMDWNPSDLLQDENEEAEFHGVVDEHCLPA